MADVQRTPGGSPGRASTGGGRVPPVRQELERTPVDASKLGEVQRQLSFAEKVWGNEAVRKVVIVLLLLLLWQGGAMWKNDALVLPSAVEAHTALWTDLKLLTTIQALPNTIPAAFADGWTTLKDAWALFKDGWSALFSTAWYSSPKIFFASAMKVPKSVDVLVTKVVSPSPVLSATWYSLGLLIIGYLIGVTIASFLSILATFTRVGRDILETLTAMFSPLPAIALVPLAMLWFGLGPSALVFVLVHSVLWPVALNMHGGFRSVSQTLKMVGANYGMNPLSYVMRILFPAAFPAVLTGLKIGWAFAWRTLIAAELVFGVASGGGGLGWYVYQAKNNLETSTVFAGLLMVIVIGLAVENLIFRTIEVRTVRKWGMQN